MPLFTNQCLTPSYRTLFRNLRVRAMWSATLMHRWYPQKRTPTSSKSTASIFTTYSSKWPIKTISSNGVNGSTANPPSQPSTTIPIPFWLNLRLLKVASTSLSMLWTKQSQHSSNISPSQTLIREWQCDICWLKTTTLTSDKLAALRWHLWEAT